MKRDKSLGFAERKIAMKPKISRFLGTVICLVLVACLIPAVASAADVETFGTPSDLEWNVNWDGETMYSCASWTCTPPFDSSGVSWYEIRVYRDGEFCFGHQAGYNTEMMNRYPVLSFDLRGPVMMDWKTGTYRFSIQAIDQNGTYQDSYVVYSEEWDYIKPEMSLTKPNNLRWEYPYARWDCDEDVPHDYNILCFYSPTKDGQRYQVHNEWNIQSGSSMPASFGGGNPYPGYYYFQVRTVSGDITQYSNSEFTELSEPYYVKMGEPTAKITGVASSGKPKISWNAVPHATEYQIYRSTSKSSGYEHLKTTSSTSFTDTTAKAGKTYYYKVRSVSGDGIKSDFSAPVSRCCDLRQPEVTAKNVSSSGKIKLSWKKVSGAEKYMIYRKSSSGGSYSRIATTASTSYTDSSAKAGTKYYYKVMAVHEKSAANSAKSETVTCTCDLARPNVTVKLSKGDPRLSWKKVSGAKKYYVYRATGKTGTYTRIKSTTKTAFTDTTAKAGKTYYYKVKAIHSNTAANSAYSAIDSIRTK